MKVKNKTMGFAMILGVLSLALIITGATYAAFVYSKTGDTINTLTAGSITLNYREKNRSITINNAMPVPENDDAKESNDYFEFNISGHTTNNDIIFSVTAALSDDSNVQMGDIVDMYLTEVTTVNNVETENPTSLFVSSIPKYNELTQTGRVDESERIEKVIFTDTITNSSGNYDKDFRLRMWIDEDADFSNTVNIKYMCGDTEVNSIDTCTDGSSPVIKHESSSAYNNNKFSVTVNVYTYEEVVLSNGGLIEPNGHFISWNELETLGASKAMISDSFDQNSEYDTYYEDYRIAKVLNDNNLTGTLVIPDDITDIKDYAFAGTDLTTVIIPNSVTTLGYAIFSDSTIEEMTMPESLTTVDWGTYNNFHNLQRITVNYNITGDAHFLDEDYHTDGLETIIFGENVVDFDALYMLSYASNLKEVIFLGDINEIPSMMFMFSEVESVVLPDSMETIDAEAFAGCSHLASINMPASLESIGNSAFSGTALTSVTLPNGVTTIGDEAFRECTSLTSINIPNSVTSIGESAFYGSENLATVNISNSSSLTSIGNSAFQDTGITAINLPNGLLSIGADAFDRTYLTSLTIPATVTSLDYSAFSYCTSMETLVINSPVHISDISYPSTLKNLTLANVLDSTIGSYAFSSSLETITLGGNITAIGDHTFDGLSALKSIVLPNSVTSIGDNAFSFCRELTNLTLPSSLTSIGDGAFSFCEKLRNLSLPNGVTTIGEYAFSLSGLTNITLPSSLTSIGDYAFESSDLTSVTIPNSVTSLGHGAFYGCSDLTSLTLPTTITAIPDSLCQDCSQLTSITIPSNITSIGEYAFNQSGLTSITIPTSVNTIGERAFLDCDDLASATFQGNSDWHVVSEDETRDIPASSLTDPAMNALDLTGWFGYHTWTRIN